MVQQANNQIFHQLFIESKEKTGFQARFLQFKFVSTR
ncbi:hypothetical protein FHS56_000630 [Thermonema lapsum]|uniref:Uncharacterized protein n=1 Tax=Thermonema lapsum TaxID=28195 RepID=A0A846MNS0_9BACT|nr:hypothetical protein [Thermonema lapsum]